MATVGSVVRFRSGRSGGKMVRQFGAPRHDALRRYLFGQRKRADLTQVGLGKRLGWSQRTISDIETGEKRVTVVELIELAEALEFDASTIVRRLTRR